MGTRTSYPHGTFSWTDLSTPDPEAAKAFYGGLFGWEHEDMPAGEAGTYTMLRIDGHDVAGLAATQEGQHPAWLSYVTVDDVDESARRAADLGATPMGEPFDVLDAGRMALIADPNGAVLALWEPREHVGAKRVNDAGCMTWNDLASPDPQASIEFYTRILGWEADEIAPGQYWSVRVGERTNGGIRPMQEGEPTAWTVYFTVEDLDRALDYVRDHGGRTLTEPMEVGPGRFAAVQDPQGAVFALYAGPVDD
jgi:uncharacterized protein